MLSDETLYIINNEPTVIEWRINNAKHWNQAHLKRISELNQEIEEYKQKQVKIEKELEQEKLALKETEDELTDLLKRREES